MTSPVSFQFSFSHFSSVEKFSDDARPVSQIDHLLESDLLSPTVNDKELNESATSYSPLTESKLSHSLHNNTLLHQHVKNIYHFVPIRSSFGYCQCLHCV